MKRTLTDLTIALPESRQLDVLSNLFEKRGAKVTRCPLVSIHDSPNQTEINSWLQVFITLPPDFLIILTGEGIKRLTGFAKRAELFGEWREALSRVHKLARGPKPNRALKVLGMQADELALQPTTDGVILSLDRMDLTDRCVAVQLYGADPNKKLQNYLQKRQVEYTTVAPYVYASNVETDKVLRLIEKLANHQLDLVCFTSKAQFDRLQRVAKQHDLSHMLVKGLQQTTIAAVGPVVADQLVQAGFQVAIMPEDKYFMKPMVTAVERLISEAKQA